MPASIPGISTHAGTRECLDPSIRCHNADAPLVIKVPVGFVFLQRNVEISGGVHCNRLGKSESCVDGKPAIARVDLLAITGDRGDFAVSREPADKSAVNDVKIITQVTARRTVPLVNPIRTVRMDPSGLIFAPPYRPPSRWRRFHLHRRCYRDDPMAIAPAVLNSALVAGPPSGEEPHLEFPAMRVMIPSPSILKAELETVKYTFPLSAAIPRLGTTDAIRPAMGVGSGAPPAKVEIVYCCAARTHALDNSKKVFMIFKIRSCHGHLLPSGLYRSNAPGPRSGTTGRQLWGNQTVFK